LQKIEKNNNYKNTQGPQKKFGGPHAAHGPHFGHVCHRWTERDRGRGSISPEKLKEKFLFSRSRFMLSMMVLSQKT
jgi:hypothetical protein